MAKKCMGCMENYDDELEVCPHCGYVEGTKPNIAYHIYPGEVLVYRYTIGKVIGYGSFGVTYLGWDNLLEKKVAIKEYLPNEFATRAEGTSEVTVFDGEKSKQFTIGKDKFSDEAKRLAAFNKSKGIIAVYDQFEDNGTSYIVMDYFDGETLQERINREGSIPYAQAIDIVLPILNSLQEVHDAGIIHRDISPDNIYLTKNGEVKLLDFGAARYASTNMSKSLSAIYKQGFAPYEQYQSSKEQGPWSDVYALAATMYYMITGILPQESMDRLAKENDKLQPPRKIVKDIPRNLSNAIMNAMIVYPKQRTQSIKEFKEEIENIQTEAKKTTYPKKFMIPGWAKVSAAASSGLLVILCICIAFGIIDLSTLLGGNSRKNLKENETYTPGIINMYVDEAQMKAEDSEVVLQIVDKVESDKVEANKVMSQDPKPGIISARDGLVNIVISKGEKEELMPDVAFERLDTAKSKLESLGFKVKVKEEVSDGYADGVVIKQSVKANTEYGVGGTITLTVAKKGKTLQGDGLVGNYENKEINDVAIDLNKHGLYVVVTERQFSSSIAEGKVISQNVQSGQKLKAGDIVEVIVSKGKELISVPDVQYKSFDEARTTLETLGFTVKKVEKESDVVQAGRIISQDVKESTRLERGKVITLTVSKGSKKLTAALNKTNQFNQSQSIANNKPNNNNTSQSNTTKPSTSVEDKPVVVPPKNWSEWTTDSSKANNSKYYVEKKTQYSSRTTPKKKEITTSASSSLSGWTKTGQTFQSEWVIGNWQRNTRPTNAMCKLNDERTVTDPKGQKAYRYWRWYCQSNNRVHFCDVSAKRNFPGTQWVKYYTKEYETSQYKGQFNQYCSCHGTPNYYVGNIGSANIYFHEEIIYHPVTYKEYQYKTLKTRTVYTFERYIEGTPSSWSAWQDQEIKASNTNTERVEVQTRTVYRYKEK